MLFGLEHEFSDSGKYVQGVQQHGQRPRVVPPGGIEPWLGILDQQLVQFHPCVQNAVIIFMHDGFDDLKDCLDSWKET